VFFRESIKAVVNSYLSARMNEEKSVRRKM
jgi:hypothetical protein